MGEKKTIQGKFLMYRGKPLMREKELICYGNPITDKYILFMMVLSTQKVDSIEIPDRIIIQVLSTDKSLSAHEKIIKQGEKRGLYDAMDIGMIWLERALESESNERNEQNGQKKA